MLCPQCKSESLKVLESRDADGGFSIRRRRECDECKYRFTTFERIELTNFLVEKKDATTEPYNRKKLERGIWIACGKRPIKKEQIDKMITELEQKWNALGKEVPSEMIGYDVMEGLKQIDDIAYIRFASVYKDFKDVETFNNQLIEFFKKK